MGGSGGRTDVELLDAVRRGHSGAFAELYDRYEPQVRRFASSLVGRAQVDDLVGEVFIKTYSALRSGRGPVDNPVRYLMTATRTTAYSVHRQRFRCEEAERTVAHELAVDDSTHEAPDGALHSALSSLPDRQRQVIWWAEVEGLSPTAIGDRLGIAPAAAASLAYRARGSLRRAYASASAA